VSRIWARSRTLWDWDEALFAIAVRSYDVTLHHPHPPGFPLYIAMAIALFPLLLWFALELRFPFRTAYLGSLLFVFFPNVWFFGGTAFRDIPALALLLGLAAAIRPQSLVVGCAPALYASWCRKPTLSRLAG
jgi:hypothetical protein